MITFSNLRERSFDTLFINEQNNLIDYSLSRDDALIFLKFYKQMRNISLNRYDTFDYAKFIYIELNFKDDTEIQELVENIKAKLYYEFINLQRYYKRVFI